MASLCNIVVTYDLPLVADEDVDFSSVIDTYCIGFVISSDEFEIDEEDGAVEGDSYEPWCITHHRTPIERHDLEVLSLRSGHILQ